MKKMIQSKSDIINFISTATNNNENVSEMSYWMSYYVAKPIMLQKA
jgi:hypothetical protein